MNVTVHIQAEVRIVATIQDLAKSLSDADAEADKAIARVQATVDGLKSKVSALEGQLAQAPADAQPMIDQLNVLKAKLAALDPTDPAVLPPT